MKKKAIRQIRREIPLGEGLTSDEVAKILAETEASLIGSLSNLKRLWETGHPNAVRMLAEFGVLCSNLLKQEDAAMDTPAANAYNEAVRGAAEWPVSCPAVVDRREAQIQKQIPSELGVGRTIDLGKTTGKGGQRSFDPTSRTGFALTYQEDLEWGRQHAKKHPLFETGLFSALRDKGMAAQDIIDVPHFFKAPNGPLLSENPNLPDSIAGFIKVENDVPEIDWSKIEEFCNDALGLWNDHGISDEMASVGPPCIAEIWSHLVTLPEFSSETVQQWIELAIRLAESRCGEEWENGPWKSDFRQRANQRIVANGGNERKAYAYVVKTMIKDGFKQLLKAASEETENR